MVLAAGCGDDPIVDEAGAAAVTPTGAASTPTEPTQSAEPAGSGSADCDGQGGSPDLSCLEGEQVRLAPANAAPPQSDVQRGVEFSGTVQEYLTYIIDDVEKMWSTWFAATTVLREPSVTKVLIDPGTTATTRCDIDEDATNAPDEIASDHRNAYYCPVDSVTDEQGVVVDGAVILPVLTFQKMWTGDILGTQSRAAGDFAAAIVTAHEMGHHVQDEIWTQLKISPEFTGANQENIADCLAGVWMASAYKNGLLTDTDHDEAVAALEAVGADAAGGVHGTPEERRTALLLGYEGVPNGLPGQPADCFNAYSS